MLPSRGKTHKGKSQDVKTKLLLQTTAEIRDHGMDQSREAGWLPVCTPKGGKKRTEWVSQGDSLPNKVGERMKVRATSKSGKL